MTKYILCFALLVSIFSCKTTKLADQEVMTILYNQLKSSNQPLITVKDSLFRSIEFLDLDGDKDSTDILVYRFIGRYPSGELDDEKTKLDLYQYRENKLNSIFLDTTDIQVSFQNFRVLTLDGKRVLFFWANPSGGSSGNTPLYEFSAYLFENNKLNPLKLTDELTNISNGHFWLDSSGRPIVRDEDIGVSYVLSRDNGKISTQIIPCPKLSEIPANSTSYILNVRTDTVNSETITSITRNSITDKKKRFVKIVDLSGADSIRADVIHFNVNDRLYICGCSDRRLSYNLADIPPFRDTISIYGRYFIFNSKNKIQITLDKYDKRGFIIKTD